MNAEEAFALYMKGHAQSDMPWELQQEQIKPIFMSGWGAHAEALKQVTLFANTESSPLDAIYAAYPRKIGKANALKAIAKAIQSGKSRAWLLDAVKNYAAATATWPAEDKQYIPHPTTWFNRASYDDDPKEWLRGGQAVSKFTKTYT